MNDIETLLRTFNSKRSINVWVKLLISIKRFIVNKPRSLIFYLEIHKLGYICLNRSLVMHRISHCWGSIDRTEHFLGLNVTELVYISADLLASRWRLEGSQRLLWYLEFTVLNLFLSSCKLRSDSLLGWLRDRLGRVWRQIPDILSIFGTTLNERVHLCWYLEFTWLDRPRISLIFRSFASLLSYLIFVITIPFRCDFKIFLF